jgi:DNA-binding NtrC family response regulator
MQTRLLRYLETSETLHIGVDKIAVRHDVRLIVSTTADLKARMADGLFRPDLYERLAVVSLAVPPLRDRRDDIPSLVDHFIEQFVGGGVPPQSVTPPIPTDISSEVYDALSRADWPGNVGELKNVVLRQLLSAGAGPSGTSMLRSA